MARRDVPFWTRVAAAAGGPVLELGCGTGRIALPVGRSGTPVVGIDLSARMLVRARTRVRRARLGRRVRLVRGDIRHLPFPDGHFALVMAPYGILQSLVGEADLRATLAAVAAALQPGGRLVLELVADLPAWHEYSNQTKLRGWRAGGRSHVTLIESVRQDRKKGLTLFEQEFVERRGRREDVATVHAGVPHVVGGADGGSSRARRPACHRASGQLRRRPVDEDLRDLDSDCGTIARAACPCTVPSAVPRARCHVPYTDRRTGTPHTARGTRHSARGTRHSAPHPAPGTQHLALSSVCACVSTGASVRCPTVANNIVF